MSATEAAGRAVCAVLAILPEAWRDHEETIRAALKAAVDTLPPELAELVRQHMELIP
jgi:hypothetical protein